MKMRQYLKNVWNDLKYDEAGALYGMGGYTPRRANYKPYTPYTPYIAPTPARSAGALWKEYVSKKYPGLKKGETATMTTLPWGPGVSYRAPGYTPGQGVTQPVVTGETEAERLARLERERLARLERERLERERLAELGGGAGEEIAAVTPAETEGEAEEFEIDLTGIWETAGEMADNEINPQLTKIDRLLQEAGYSAEDSQRAINEAYPVARRSLQKSIYENMVAGEQSLATMGTGRGGGRQELLARAGEREATGLEAIETAKQREVGAIQRALGQYRGGLGRQRTALAGRRGALQSAYSEQLRGARFSEAATRAKIGLNQAQLAESTRQFNETLAENVRQFNANQEELIRQFNETLANIGTPAAGGEATTPGGQYFDIKSYLDLLGLGTTKTTTKKRWH